jgi:hypothetical protein
MTTTVRVTGAAALLVAAAVHVAQLVSIFHAVPWIGPLFAADAVASTILAVALFSSRWRVAAALGALVSASALAGLAWSSTIGLFGWQEVVLRPSVKIAIGSELVAFATLAPLALSAPVRSRVLPRALAGAGLVAIAGLHLAAAGDEWGDTRGIFWLFIALAAACLALAVRLGFGLDRWSWAAVSGLAAAAMAGYVLSRSTGLPGATDDIGDWANPLGVAALAVEAALIPLAVLVLRSRDIRIRPQHHPSARSTAPVVIGTLAHLRDRETVPCTSSTNAT